MKKTYTFYIFLVVKIKGAKYIKHLQTLIIQKRKLKHGQESRLRKIRPRLYPWALVSYVIVRWHLPPFPKRPHFSTLSFLRSFFLAVTFFGYSAVEIGPLFLSSFVMFQKCTDQAKSCTMVKSINAWCSEMTYIDSFWLS